MLGRLLLYLGMLIVGIIIGKTIKIKDKSMKNIQRFQIVAISILLFTMGVGIGADKKVIGSITEIGVKAGVIAIFTIVGSVLGVFLCRKMLGINMKGEKND